ncbi:hypothetical protein C5H22_04955 [Xylella fastidiosa]|nr:hypothetical protein C5H22_04955 [Xylella fastidiosa]
MVIGGARDGAGRKQGGKAAVAGCFGVSLGCIGAASFALFLRFISLFFGYVRGGKVWVVSGV